MMGAKQVRRFLEKERVNRIILLSDGLANQGPSSTSELASLGRELRGEGIAVSTIGLGDDYNEDLMTALAESSNANYYYVKDAEKLPGIFAEELGAARSLLARSVIIRIQAPDGVRLKEIIGRPDIECRDRVAEIKMPELFGSEKRRFLVRCVAEGNLADPIEAAQVELNYASRDGAPAPAQRLAAKVAFTDDEKKADKSVQAGSRTRTERGAEPPRERAGGKAGRRRQSERRRRCLAPAGRRERRRARCRCRCREWRKRTASWKPPRTKSTPRARSRSRAGKRCSSRTTATNIRSPANNSDTGKRRAARPRRSRPLDRKC